MAFVDKILLFLFCLHFKVILSTCLPPNEDMQEAVRKLKEDGKSMKGKVDTMGSLEDLVFKLIGQVGEIKGIVETMKGDFESKFDKMEWKMEGNFKEIQSKIVTLEYSEWKVEENFKEMQSKIASLENSESKMEVKMENISRDVINGTKELEKELEKKVKESEFLNTTNIINNEIKQLKSRGLLDRVFPVNSIHVTFANITPPMQGQYGVNWEQLPKGFVLMTGNEEDVGTRTGSQRLDGGNTNGHALSVDEMPSHTHTYSHILDRQEDIFKSGSDYHAAYTYESLSTSSTGGNRPHHHTLDIFNQKVLVWRRTS